MIGWRQLSFFIVFVLLSIAAACNGDGAAPNSTGQGTGAASGVSTGQETGGSSGVATACQNAISWDKAYEHVGERATVRGPVKSPRYASGSRGQPTFLNVGRPYPDPDRFTVVIWGEDRGNFPSPPEQAYDGETICVTGLIETYQGGPQIIADSPSDIEIVD